MDIFITVTLVILIAVINAFFIKKSKSLAEPAIVFSVLFGAQMLLSLLFLQQDIGGVYLGFFWITAGVSSFAFGSLLIMWRQRRRHSAQGTVARKTAKGYEIYDRPAMNIVLALLLLFSFSQPVITIYRLGYNIGDIFKLNTLLEINSTAAYKRYVEHNFATSALTQIFLVLVYLLPLIGGWNFIFSKKTSTKILCACTVIPSILVLFTQNTKAAFIGSILLFLCSFLTAKFHKSGAFFRIKLKNLLLIIPAAAVFLLLNYATFFLREGNLSWSLFMAVNNKVLNYLLGQMPAFNYWFSGNPTNKWHTLGLETFYSVPQSLGLLKRAPGIYAEKLVTIHLNTNVYTAFRPLIEDFSSLGALLVLFAAGAASGFCFERLRAGMARCLDIAFITALYFYIFYAFITSPFEYVSYTAALVLFFGYLLLMRKHVVFIRDKADPASVTLKKA